LQDGLRRRDVLALLAVAPIGIAGPAPLRRGVNLTNWFRYPPSADPAALESYLSDAAMAALRHAGFDFVRLAVQPDFVRDERLDIVLGAIARLQRQGFAVIVGPHPPAWRLETSAADRAALLAFWRRLAPRLRPLDPRLTVPEVVNEPVFRDDASGWAALQQQTLAIIRISLKRQRVLLTGNDWGGVVGLLGLHPVEDADAIYGFHFYDPSELTSLAAYREGLDRMALARQPFPTTEKGCVAAARTRDVPTRDLIHFVCATQWNADTVDARIAMAAQWGERHGVPVLLGEFGASAALNAPSRLAWIAAVRQSCERHGIGWALWGYDDSMGFGVQPTQDGAPPKLDPALLAALGMT
jgi:endoglucanase